MDYSYLNEFYTKCMYLHLHENDAYNFDVAQIKHNMHNDKNYCKMLLFIYYKKQLVFKCPPIRE